jgi:hypothetical protein
MVAGAHIKTNIIKVIISRRMTLTGRVALMGKMINAYILVGKSEGKRVLGRPRRRQKEWILGK